MKFIESFDSLEQFVNTAADLPKQRHEAGTADAEWVFGREVGTLAATLEHLRDGRAPKSVWKAMEKNAQKLTASMEVSESLGIDRRRKLQWSDTGDEICTDRMLSGHDRPWRTVRIGRTRPIVRLGINLAISCGNGEADFADITGKLCAACDYLNVRGYGMEIVGLLSCTSRRHGTPWCYRVTLKSAEDPLDISKIGSCGTPGMLRALGFRVFERDMPSEAWNGPCTTDWNDSQLEIADVDYVISKYWNLEKGMQNILAQGCELQPV